MRMALDLLGESVSVKMCTRLMGRYQASAGIGKEAADLAFGYLAKKGKVSSKL
jgi:hypothetical protein